MKNDNDLLSKIKYILIVAVSSISLILMGILAVSSFLKTASANNMTEQLMEIKTDNMLISGIVTIIFLGIGFLLIKDMHYLRLKSLFIFTIIWNIAWSAFFILFGRSAPGADALTVFTMANDLAHGDLSFIDYTGSYLSFYPQQVGLTVFLASLIKLIGLIPVSLSVHHFIKIIYAIFNCLTIVFGYKCVKEIWKNERACAVFLYLSVLNFPFIMYSSFIYGEIPSICAMCISSYFLIKSSKKKHESIYLLISVIFLASAVFVRKNSLIFMIAYIIVAVMIFMEKKKASYLLFAVIALVLGLTVLPLTQKALEKKSGETLNSGVTMYSYIAMGMQEGTRGSGWYNGFNYDTYYNTGMNTKKTNEIAAGAISERMGYFKDDPGEAFAFYMRKFLTQWCDPTLASCQATYADFGKRADFVEEIYNGRFNKYYVMICNVFQNIVYIGAFLWCLKNFIKVLKPDGEEKSKAVVYLGLITVIGGFLFHMMWEANSRYILPYACMLLPYAAAGYASFVKNNHGFTDKDE